MVASQWINKRKEKKLNIDLAVRASQWLKEAVYDTNCLRAVLCPIQGQKFIYG